MVHLVFILTIDLPKSAKIPYQAKQCRTKVKKFFGKWQKNCPTKTYVQESLHLQAVLLDKSDENFVR